MGKSGRPALERSQSRGRSHPQPRQSPPRRAYRGTSVQLHAIHGSPLLLVPDRSQPACQPATFGPLAAAGMLDDWLDIAMDLCQKYTAITGDHNAPPLSHRLALVVCCPAFPRVLGAITTARKCTHCRPECGAFGSQCRQSSFNHLSACLPQKVKVLFAHRHCCGLPLCPPHLDQVSARTGVEGTPLKSRFLRNAVLHSSLSHL